MLKIILLTIFTLISPTLLALQEEDFTAKINEISDMKELYIEIEKIGEAEIIEKFDRALLRVKATLQKIIATNNYPGGFLKHNTPFKRALKKIDDVSFYFYFKGRSSTICKKNTLAFHMHSSLNYGDKNKEYIRVCPISMIQTEDIVTQIVLHEMFHVAGYRSEHHASLAEILALTYSDIKNPLKSGYWEVFNLSKSLKSMNRFLSQP